MADLEDSHESPSCGVQSNGQIRLAMGHRIPVLVALVVTTLLWTACGDDEPGEETLVVDMHVGSDGDADVQEDGADDADLGSDTRADLETSGDSDDEDTPAPLDLDTDDTDGDVPEVSEGDAPDGDGETDPFAGLCPEGYRSSEADLDHLRDADCESSDHALQPGVDRMGSGWQLIALPDAEELGAVCNTGEPYTFSIRPGRGDGADKWLIFLEGGGACGNETSCHARVRARPDLACPLATADPGLDGMWDRSEPDNPWADWNHVFLNYCSSDGWMGDAGPNEHRSYFFRGRVIVREVTAFLSDPPEGWPRLGDADLILFGGGSAGANGFKHNVDDFAAAVAPAEVLGFNDSAVVVDIPSIDLGTGLSKACYQNSQPDVSCLASEADPLACMDHVNVLFNHISTPTFAYMDQFDENSHEILGATGLCIEPQCGSDTSCGDGVCVANRICVTSTCSVDATCEDGGMCSETGCYRRDCTGDDECDGDLSCVQGFCAHPDTCGNVVSGCSSGGCVPRDRTPLAQEFAAAVRDAFAELDAAYSSRLGIHVISRKDEFWREIDGHPSVASVLEAWVFDLEGPTAYVWEP